MKVLLEEQKKIGKWLAEQIGKSNCIVNNKLILFIALSMDLLKLVAGVV